MTTINKVLRQVSETKPNPYDDRLLFSWINELDGRISLEVMKRDTPVAYDFSGDRDVPLLADGPYENIYALYLYAMIDFLSREIAGYNNSMSFFNEMFQDYKKQYIRTNLPPSAKGFRL
ncbi:MAG: hypothetical protein LBL09_00510 [Oscillospiraceae bacterium]|jgi:hypothetical protein|nr:hypothetical protein [Oscillospiraceae bacterium]